MLASTPRRRPDAGDFSVTPCADVGNALAAQAYRSCDSSVLAGTTSGGPGEAKAVRVDEIGVEDHLKGERCADLLLKVRERRAHGRLAVLHLGEEPGTPVARPQEADLPLLLVAQVPELEPAEPQVVPAVDRLQQVAGHERLRSP